ncbi:hypothetical protein N1851_006459 [Merluccius polli]|uniref:DUF4806 domain-containing protein n=1 Tax=Merluccius polli TaxID=89951 RepID=A0AA47N5C7_MERPO|nr:hypothetical protein N1851_006459 [Merluccius polli]
MLDMQRGILRVVQDCLSSPPSTLPDTSFLPIRDPVDLVALDDAIKTKQVKRKDLVITLGLLGGANLKDTVWRVMKQILVNNLATRINWTGLHGKLAFNKLEMKNVVIEGVRRNPRCKDASEQEVEHLLKRWFYLASDRDGGRKRRSTPSSSSDSMHPQQQEQSNPPQP